MAIFHYDPANSKVVYQTSAWTKSQLPFVVALMGWMPGPIELGAWYSLWFQAKNRGQYRLDFMYKLDFNFGYVLVIVTAVFFVTLGALVLHSSGELISKNPPYLPLSWYPFIHQRLVPGLNRLLVWRC